MPDKIMNLAPNHRPIRILHVVGMMNRGDSDRLYHFDRSEVVATATDRSRDP